jgi:hypothetical protein
VPPQQNATEFIPLTPNAEYTESTAILQGVLDATDEAGLAIAAFEGRTGKISLNRIATGLHGRGEKAAKDNGDIFDEVGSPGVAQAPWGCTGITAPLCTSPLWVKHVGWSLVF